MIEFTNNSDERRRVWSATVSSPSGGVQVANVEYATSAPESGYKPMVYLDQDSAQPPGFQGGTLYKGERFYVKSASGYGFVEFRMVPGNQYLRLTSRLNPRSRNLEDGGGKIDPD